MLNTLNNVTKIFLTVTYENFSFSQHRTNFPSSVSEETEHYISNDIYGVHTNSSLAYVQVQNTGRGREKTGVQMGQK